MSFYQGLEQPAIDTLRISLDDWHRILERLEHQDRGRAPQNRRRDPRHPYRNVLGLLVQLPTASGEMSNYLVKSRNLSTRGISFLHGQYIPRGTLAVVTLVQADMSQHRRPGTICHCRHIQGNVHEIGMKFDAPIVPASYTRP